MLFVVWLCAGRVVVVSIVGIVLSVAVAAAVVIAGVAVESSLECVDVLDKVGVAVE